MSLPPEAPVLSDVLWLLPAACAPDDAFACALVSRALRDALHDLYPWREQGGVAFRFATPLAACLASETRMAWARSMGAPWTGRKCLVGAARMGNLDLCRWLMADADVCSAITANQPIDLLRAAAIGGHVHVLEWARESHKLPWDASVCAAAAHGGQLETVQWLRLHCCPWDKATTTWAAVEGHAALLAWARENGCDFSEETCTRLKLAKWSLAGKVESEGAGTYRVENGVVIVQRHQAFLPPG